MKLILLCSLAFGFESIQYERKVFESIPSETLWTNVSDNSGNVTLITPEYYDTRIVSRWTNQWFAGNTTWIIGVTKDVPFEQNYMFNVVAKTIHIVNNIFAGNNTIRFGLVNSTECELLQVTLVGHSNSGIVMLKDGILYRDAPFKEAYHYVHEFIQHTYTNRSNSAAQGRISVVGLYWSYVIKDIYHI